MMCLGVFFFHIACVWNLTSLIFDFIIFIKFEMFLAVISSDTFFCPSPSMNTSYTHIRPLKVLFHSSLMLFSFINYFFPLCVCSWIASIAVSSESQICFSAMFDMPFDLCSIFHFFVSGLSFTFLEVLFELCLYLNFLST